MISSWCSYYFSWLLFSSPTCYWQCDPRKKSTWCSGQNPRLCHRQFKTPQQQKFNKIVIRNVLSRSSEGWEASDQGANVVSFWWGPSSGEQGPKKWKEDQEEIMLHKPRNKHFKINNVLSDQGSILNYLLRVPSLIYCHMAGEVFDKWSWGGELSP